MQACLLLEKEIRGCRQNWFFSLHVHIPYSKNMKPIGRFDSMEGWWCHFAVDRSTGLVANCREKIDEERQCNW
ncbi:Os05g0587300 [Oryza sativa Japonica Group]|uniref:Os05g0587300 protein n=1 Tax=Oryza sativa subsp. japonica TaxID=39947 RepID=A0A0P0WRN8_ORYSJ|nr:hypothetical protein EE612_031429 [Oryza sativa]BAS95586.1 Os05g0587300 [Oryza sativa Japonica Group]